MEISHFQSCFWSNNVLYISLYFSWIWSLIKFNLIGVLSFSGRSYCKSWRDVVSNLTEFAAWFPNHNFCRNSQNKYMQPWCYVAYEVKQYCTDIVRCPVSCPAPDFDLKGWGFKLNFLCDVSLCLTNSC